MCHLCGSQDPSGFGWTVSDLPSCGWPPGGQWSLTSSSKRWPWRVDTVKKISDFHSQNPMVSGGHGSDIIQYFRRSSHAAHPSKSLTCRWLLRINPIFTHIRYLYFIHHWAALITPESGSDRFFHLQVQGVCWTKLAWHKGQEPGRLKLHASKALGPLLAPRLMKKRLE